MFFSPIGFHSRMLKKVGWGSWDDPLARRTCTVKLCSFDARSWGHPTYPLKSGSSLRPSL